MAAVSYRNLPACLNGREHAWKDDGPHVFCCVCGVLVCHCLPKKVKVRGQTTKKYPRGFRGKATTPKLRELLRERDGDWCYHCGHRLAQGQETIDHLRPRALGGTNERSNLVLACRWCNHLKGDTSVAVFQADERLYERRKHAIRCRLRELTEGTP